VKVESHVERIPKFVEIVGTASEVALFWDALRRWSSDEWVRDLDAETAHPGDALILRYEGSRFAASVVHLARCETRISVPHSRAVASARDLTLDEIDAITDELVEGVLKPVNASLPIELVLEIGPPEEHRINLEGMSFLGTDGARRRLKQDYYAAYEFVREIEDYWLSPIKCKECGKRSTCVFPQRDPSLLGGEQPCEVTLLALNTTAEHLWPSLANLEANQVQDGLDALFHVTRFADEGERSIGRLCSRTYQNWLATMVPMVLSDPIYLRNDLDALATKLKELPFGHQNAAVLVEGESEAAFLRELANAGRIVGTAAYPYGGSGTAKYLREVVTHLRDRGMRVFVQGDLDGKSAESKQNWRRKLEERGAHVFLFQRDFEAAFTHDQRVHALSRLAEIPLQGASDVLEDANSLIGVLERFNISKTDYAKALANAWADLSQWDAECEITNWIRQIENPEQPT
jgi:hypothetical protein